MAENPENKNRAAKNRAHSVLLKKRAKYVIISLIV